MGFIADLAQKNVSGVPVQVPTVDGRRLWREVFATDKESGQRQGVRPRGSEKPVPGGSYGRAATISSEASFVNLVKAMRSWAPGGWSDDRFEQSRHFVGIAYVAIHRIVTQWQMSEFQVFKEDENHPDGKRPITKHDPAEGDRHVRPWDLVKLLKKPNGRDSFGKLMYRWGQQKYLTGTALTWMLPNALGVPMELYCIPTALAIPQPVVNPDYPDGYYRIQPIYPYGPFSSYPTPTSAVGAAIPAQWMMRFQFAHPLLFYDGYSPLTALRLHMDEIEMIDRSRHSSMRGNVNPSAVMDLSNMEDAQPWQEDELERVRAEFEAVMQGPENAGKLLVPPPGGKIEQWGSRPLDMDFQSGWDQLCSFILAGMGITKPAAGMTDDSNYSTLFATLKQLYTLTLEPDVNDVAAELTRHLAPFFGDDLIVEIRCKPINDHDINFAKIDKGIQAKCLKKNDVLKLLDLPVTQEEWGDEFAGEGEEQQQPGLPGMEGAGGIPEQGTPPGQEPGQEPGEAEAAEVEAERPAPGNLATGALGPRKALIKALRQKYHLNGHSNGTNGHSKG